MFDLNVLNLKISSRKFAEMTSNKKSLIFQNVLSCILCICLHEVEAGQGVCVIYLLGLNRWMLFISFRCDRIKNYVTDTVS